MAGYSNAIQNLSEKSLDFKKFLAKGQSIVQNWTLKNVDAQIDL